MYFLTEEVSLSPRPDSKYTERPSNHNYYKDHFKIEILKGVENKLTLASSNPEGKKNR